MPALGINPECSICCRDDVGTARYCVYCIALLMCTGCRTQLPRERECPQCRRHLSKTPPDLLITGSQPRNGVRASSPREEPDEVAPTFEFRSVLDDRSDATYLRIGFTGPPDHFNVYVHPNSVESTAKVVYLSRFGDYIVNHEVWNDNERLRDSVTPYTYIGHLGWLEFLAYVQAMSEKRSPVHLRDDRRMIILKAEPEIHAEKLQSSTQGISRNLKDI